MQWVLIAIYLMHNSCSHPQRPNDGCFSPPLEARLGTYATAEECGKAQAALAQQPANPLIRTNYQCREIP